MSDRLPPLTALRAFEAAARHMSFARAAEELNVTPAALSFQIKSLEEHLGTPVFRRLNRAVELTEAGQVLAPGTSDAFQALSTAWRAALRLQDEGALTVTAGPAFTAKCWRHGFMSLPAPTQKSTFGSPPAYGALTWPGMR